MQVEQFNLGRGGGGFATDLLSADQWTNSIVNLIQEQLGIFPVYERKQKHVGQSEPENASPATTATSSMDLCVFA